MATLVYRYPGKPERCIFECGERPVLIGRSNSADLSLADTSVSKNHLRIEQRVGRYWFRDLGSRNGTYVNDIRSPGGPLSDGDELRIGVVLIQFCRDKVPDSMSSRQAPRTSPREGQDEPSLAGETDETIVKKDSAQEERVLPEVDTRPDREREYSGQPEKPQLSAATTDILTPVAVTSPAHDRTGSGSPVTAHGKRGRRGVSLQSTLLVAVVFLGLGFALARLTAPRTVERSLAVDPSLMAEPSLATELESVEDPPGGKVDAALPAADLGPGADSVVGTGGRESDLALEVGADPDSVTEESLTFRLGPEADLSDPEISRRLLYRLFLDLLGRTPTRAEARKLLPLSHRERWEALRRLAGSEGGAPSLKTASDVSNALLGRGSRTQQMDLIFNEFAGDKERAGRLIASSRQYASLDHQRRRSPLQRARSLWVDLTDTLPKPAHAAALLHVLSQHPDEPLKVLRPMVYSDNAHLGPEELGLEPEPWIQEAYCRLLLRQPSSAEKKRTVEELRRDPGAWRLVLLELALRPEYLRY